MTGSTALLLLDNGSLAPESTLSLRRIAADLSLATSIHVAPVSLLHSSKVPASLLGGIPAETLVPAIRRRFSAGISDFIIVPLFFGPSGALIDYLPGRIRDLRAGIPGLRVRLAPPIAAPGDPRLGDVLADQVRAVLARRPPEDHRNSPPARVILVDHGSPRPAVADVRDRLASELAARLGPSVGAVAAASMERRPEPQYDFNEPLLARALDEASCGGNRVILSLLFLSPGRHAGPGGDIDRICAEARSRHPKLDVERTALVGEHPGIIAILADRARGPMAEL